MARWCSEESGGEVYISEGDNLSLPCDLSDTLWRRNNEEILYITAARKILPFSNVDLKVAGNRTHLIIKNIRPGDAGVRKKRKTTYFTDMYIFIEFYCYSYN